MPVLFKSKIGAVVKLDDPALQCTTRLLGLDPDIGFATERSIVTRMTMDQQVNVQFLHTLGSLVYIYVFGDRVGSLSLSGLAFACDCDDPDASSGLEEMYKWYKQYRASKRSAPVRVTLGREVIEGFATRFTADVVDPSVSLVQWGMNLNSLPDDE